MKPQVTSPSYHQDEPYQYGQDNQDPFFHRLPSCIVFVSQATIRCDIGYDRIVFLMIVQRPRMYLAPRPTLIPLHSTNISKTFKQKNHKSLCV